MEYELDYQAVPGIVLVNFNRNMTKTFALEVVNEAMIFAKQKDCDQFLFDLSQVDNEEDAFGQYAFAREMGLLGFKKTFQLAVFVGEKMTEHKFVETVLVNRGFWVKFFVDKDDARSWLISRGKE